MVSLSDRIGIAALEAPARRLLEGLLTALAAVTLTFLALRVAAGDPVASLLSQGLTTPEQAEAMQRSLGYDLPLHEQYFLFLSNLARGDLGVSLYSGQSVVDIIGRQLPSTIQLALFSLAVALPLGILLGAVSSWSSRPALQKSAVTLSSLATSLPVATTGVISLLIVSAVGGEVRLWLPAVVLGYAVSGPFARAVHSGLESSLSSSYVLAAKARGLQRSRRYYWHALRPALPAAVALLALEAAFLFAGAVVTETVFSRPGLGRTLVSSILQGDFPVAQGIVALAAMIYVATRVLADGFGWVLDPRMRGTD